MVQDPFKVDQLRIHPSASVSPILLYDVAGDLAFKDASVTGGLLFKQLAGLTVDNLFLVGQAGLGATYTTIQAALDAVPSTSSPTNPYVILVGPGVYSETINLVRDGVFIIGWGATLESEVESTPDAVGAYHTLVIQAGLGTIPKNVVIQGLTITNAHSGFACVRVVGGAASEVGSGGIVLLDCNLKSTSATGNRPLWASSVNKITVQGGSMAGCNATSLLYLTECSNLTLDHVRDVPGCQLDYDSGATLPFLVGSSYLINGCSDLAGVSTLSPPLKSTLLGVGSLRISGCTGGRDVIFDGDRSLTLQGSFLGDLTLNGTTAATSFGTSFGTAVGLTATLAEPFQRDVVTFVAATTFAVVFPVPHPDDDYHVNLTPLDHPSTGEVPWVTTKTATGFTINFFAAQSLDVEWSVSRRM